MKRFISSLKISLVALGLVASLAALGFGSTVQAAAGDVITDACSQQGTSNSALCTNNSTELVTGTDSIFFRIINTIILVVGALAVLMIVIGGMKYVLSAGDSSAISSAKNTILYAIVGIVIAISAYSIVNFVIAKI